jgi:hypothetical protein
MTVISIQSQVASGHVGNSAAGRGGTQQKSGRLAAFSKSGDWVHQ